MLSPLLEFSNKSNLPRHSGVTKQRKELGMWRIYRAYRSLRPLNYPIHGFLFNEKAINFELFIASIIAFFNYLSCLDCTSSGAWMVEHHDATIMAKLCANNAKSASALNLARKEISALKNQLKDSKKEMNQV